jgi:hypothetical protein
VRYWCCHARRVQVSATERMTACLHSPEASWSTLLKPTRACQSANQREIGGEGSRAPDGRHRRQTREVWCSEGCKGSCFRCKQATATMNGQPRRDNLICVLRKIGIIVMAQLLNASKPHGPPTRLQEQISDMQTMMSRPVFRLQCHRPKLNAIPVVVRNAISILLRWRIRNMSSISPTISD